MTTIDNSPEQTILNTGRFDWEAEETLVDRRNRLPNRMRRFFSNGLIWKAPLILFSIGLFSAPFMLALLNVVGVIFGVGMFMLTLVVQFVAIFWFLSRSRIYEVYPGAEGVSFSDYRGQPELLEQAEQIVTLLRGVKAFEKSGGESLNGLMLEGPPGTGKTWLAKAISTEAGVPFFYVDTSSLQGMMIGTSTLKVMQVYGKARRKAKEYGAAVVFLDEIDTVGARGGVSTVGGGMGGGMGGMGAMGGMSGDMGLLSTLLVQMSGFSLEHGWRPRLRAWLYRTILRREPPKPEKRVLTIGATNRVSALDPALLRPGRFDKKIRVDVPDMEGRRDIIKYYLGKFAHDSSVDPAILATETPGYSPAEIKFLLNDALRHALFDGRRYITYKDFRLAQPEHEMGLRAPLKHLSPEARERMAYYQAGKAAAVRLFIPENRITRISIVRQGFAFGHVWHYPAKEVYQGLRTKDQHMNRLRVTIAGKAAEIEFCGLEFQTLAVERDYGYMQNLLYAMASAGMFGAMGGAMFWTFDAMKGQFVNKLTPDQGKTIDEAYQIILNETRRALRENKTVVQALATLLLEKEELLAEEVQEFFDQYGLHTPEPSVMINGQEVSLLAKNLAKQIVAGEQEGQAAGAD